MRKAALITGISGQDGSYLAEFLLERGYEVHGTVRDLQIDQLARIRHLLPSVTLHEANLLDPQVLAGLVRDIAPTEIYNLAGHSVVSQGWGKPTETADATGLGVTRWLEAVRTVNPAVRMFQASSSDMFGRVSETPQSERTASRPCSPYAAAKVYAHWITGIFRDSFGLFACSGILFPHESPRRGLEFVTRQITHAAARVRHGLNADLRLSDLGATYDWGFAGDYVRAMWLMLQQDRPQDYVIGSGETHSVQEFAEVAFRHAQLDWRNHVVVDSTFPRPTDVRGLRADSSKAQQQLAWRPVVPFEKLVGMMVDADMARLADASRQPVSVPAAAMKAA